MNPAITVSVEVDAPIEKVWHLWTTPLDIMQWNNVSDKWHTPRVENDVRPGGRFLFTMGLKDGGFMFDHAGVYNEVQLQRLITYTLDEGRKSTIAFEAGDTVTITETFEPNDTDPLDMQLHFCEAVLQSFKKYAESK
jgi:uncharacterized protein YndB with AHSA1/START domain